MNLYKTSPDGAYVDSPAYRVAWSEENYEAEYFAMCLMMPEKEYCDFVKANANDHMIDMQLVADHFGVERWAAVKRGRQIGVIPW